MNVDHGENSRGKRRLGSATHRLMESYKDDYPSHAKGIMQEAIQNAIDARVSNLDFDKVRIVIEYSPEERILKIRDYGTTGMSHCKNCDWGIRKDNQEDCHDKDCKWGNFHYLGGLAKGSGQLGSRGQGKSLLVVAGKQLIIRSRIATNDDSLITMASKWSLEGEDWYWVKAPEEGMAASKPAGTEFEIHDIINEVHNQLMDFEEIKKDISRTWFSAIEKGVVIRFGYAGKELKKISATNFPSAETSEDGKAITRHRASIPISYNRQVVGELNDVTLVLSAEPVPEEIKGIALIKNGTQVITRISTWGRKIRPELQDRLYGWATYFCTDEKPFLLRCEKPGHRGFNPHPVYTKVEEAFQQNVDDFLMPFEKKWLKPRLSEKDRKRAQQNLQIIQRALAEMPDFNPWSGTSTIPIEKKPRPVPTHPYISDIQLDKDSYQQGEKANASFIIMNPTHEFQPFIHLAIEALDEGLNKLAIWELPPEKLPLLGPAKDEEKGRIAVGLEILISEDFGEGRNWVRCILLERKIANDAGSTNYQPLVENLLDQGMHSLWVGIEPEKKTRKSPTGGTSGEDGKPGNVQKIVPTSEEAFDPVEHEIIPMWAEAEMWFFTKGARIGPVYDSDPRTADSILYEIISEAIAEKIARSSIETDPRDIFDKSQILEKMTNIESLRKKFLRSCEKYRSQMTS